MDLGCVFLSNIFIQGGPIVTNVATEDHCSNCVQDAAHDGQCLAEIVHLFVKFCYYTVVRLPDLISITLWPS